MLGLEKLGKLLRSLTSKKREPFPLEATLGIEAYWLEKRQEEIEKARPGTSEEEKADLEYFQKQLFKGLKIPEGYEKGDGPYIEVDGKIVAQAKPGEGLVLKDVKITPKGIEPKDE